MCWGAEDSKQWMNYMGIINDGTVAGRSLAVFILENEGSIKKKPNIWHKQCQNLERAEQFEICVLALVSAPEFLDRVGSRLYFLIICFSFSDTWKSWVWLGIISHWLKLLQLKSVGTRPWRNKLFYSAKSWQVYKIPNQEMGNCFSKVIFISCHNIPSTEVYYKTKIVNILKPMNTVATSSKKCP